MASAQVPPRTGPIRSHRCDHSATVAVSGTGPPRPASTACHACSASWRVSYVPPRCCQPAESRHRKLHGQAQPRAGPAQSLTCRSAYRGLTSAGHHNSQGLMTRGWPVMLLINFIPSSLLIIACMYDHGLRLPRSRRVSA